MNDLERAQARDRLANELLANARNEALEDAERQCDLQIGVKASVEWVNACMACIAAIRVLKDK